MARIKGVDIPNDKQVETSITYIYGIGRKLAKTIVTNAKVEGSKRVKDLDNDELTRLRDEISNYVNYVIYRYEKQKTAAERFDDECAKAQAWAKETGLSEQDILVTLKEIRSENQRVAE